jgi:hypothetical protein
VQLAEQMITGALGFSPAPDWVVEDAVPVAWSRQMPWRVSARASRGYIIGGGIEAWSVIQAARTIVWSDSDGDTYKETGTVTATLPSPEPPIEEIALVDPDGVEIRPHPGNVRRRHCYHTVRALRGCAALICKSGSTPTL